jgi:hypothetical protein
MSLNQKKKRKIEKKPKLNYRNKIERDYFYKTMNSSRHRL